jgi:hypothetical protein
MYHSRFPLAFYFCAPSLALDQAIVGKLIGFVLIFVRLSSHVCALPQRTVVDTPILGV